MIDSHIPRFSQAVQAVTLAVAFLFDVRLIVPVVAAIMLVALKGGPRLNLFAWLYRALPIPRGEPEAAAPPRFAQTIGVTFLAVSVVFLYVTRDQSAPWWILGWGPALLVAALSALAATTGLCVGCEIYLFVQRSRSRRERLAA